MSVPEAWDAEAELATDRSHERRLLVLEVLILLVIAGLIALRVILVHGN